MNSAHEVSLQFMFSYHSNTSLDQLPRNVEDSKLVLQKIHACNVYVMSRRRLSVATWYIKLRQDEEPPCCIKAEQGIPAQGTGSKKPAYAQEYILAPLPEALFSKRTSYTTASHMQRDQSSRTQAPHLFSSVPFSRSALNIGDGNIDIKFETEHSIVTYFQHSHQLWVSTLTTVHCRKKHR